MSSIVSEIRIPTLLGLGVLIVGLVMGVFLVLQRQILTSRANQSFLPKNVTVANISDTSFSIFWQTDQPTIGFVQAGPTSSLEGSYLDERDGQSPKLHSLHFVTLTNLKPNTLYYYQIRSGSNLYPKATPPTTKTAPTLEVGEKYQPIMGVILAPNKKGTEALVILDLPEAQKLATITKAASNFVLPLTGIRTSSLDQPFFIPEETAATLAISNGSTTSQVKIFLPPQGNPLPPITLSQDADFTNQQVVLPTGRQASPSSSLAKFDLSGDGVINSLDAGLLFKYFGKNFPDKKMDLNKDGVINQKDVEILREFIPSENALKSAQPPTGRPSAR